MKHPFNARAPAFDAQAIQDTIERAFASAGLDTRAGPMHDVSETIRRALAAGQGPAGPAADEASVIDVVARVVPAGDEPATPADPAPADPSGPPGAAAQRPGSFERCVFTSEAGTRPYKVYVPAVMPEAPCAMLVMLHGCTQSADDFAAGTQMNRLADAHGFVVVYPEQTAQANTSKCWNWFQPQDQQRGAGEPALIAGIVRHVARQQGADLRRIFVAGLSAGAAMAVVLGQTYPDLFAGVGAHSGLPYASAHDLPSALAAMKGGRSRRAAARPAQGVVGEPGGAGDDRGGGAKAAKAVPVIVFHGDRDHTVAHGNALAIVQQALAAHATEAGSALRATTQTGVAPGGHRFSRTLHTDARGTTRIEHWVVQGGGHAWSGGHPSGSFTDVHGPDASAEMLRFFMALPRDASA